MSLRSVIVRDGRFLKPGDLRRGPVFSRFIRIGSRGYRTLYLGREVLPGSREVFIGGFQDRPESPNRSARRGACFIAHPEFDRSTLVEYIAAIGKGFSRILRRSMCRCHRSHSTPHTDLCRLAARHTGFSRSAPELHSGGVGSLYSIAEIRPTVSGISGHLLCSVRSEESETAV